MSEETAPKKIWFITNKMLEHLSLQYQAANIETTKVGTTKTVGENKTIDFDYGFYATSDSGEAKFLMSHKFYDSDNPIRGFRKCSDDEIALLKKWHEKAIPRKTWHKRIKHIENAVNLKDF